MASDRLVCKTVYDTGPTNFMSDRTRSVWGTTSCSSSGCNEAKDRCSVSSVQQSLRNDELLVIRLQQSQGQVLGVLSAAESALLSSGCRVTYGLISPSRATLNSSAMSSWKSTDIGSSSSNVPIVSPSSKVTRNQRPKTGTLVSWLSAVVTVSKSYYFLAVQRS